MIQKPDDFSDREWRELLLSAQCLSDKYLTNAIRFHREGRERKAGCVAAATNGYYPRLCRRRHGEYVYL